MWRRALVTGSAVLALGAAPASAEPLVGVVGGGLVTFDSARPDVYTSVVGLSGLAGGDGEQVIGIDFRANPVGVADVEAAKQLFLVTKVDTGATADVRIYTVDPGTGAATPIGTPVSLTDGDGWGIDFNHTVDRIRIVNDADENARLNPNNGARADSPGGDNDLSPGGLDVAGAAYDRVDTDAATGTTLYGFAASTAQLVTIGGLNSTPSPNAGAVNVVGASGLVAIPFDASVNFDISPSGTAFASALASPLNVPTLYSANLATGALTGIARTPTTLNGLAVVPASTVQFGATAFTQGEAGGTATISVTRGGSLTRTTRASYRAGDASGTLVFAPGETAKTFTVPVADDRTDNPDRTIALSLTGGDALTVPGAGATLTITDDDAAPPAPDTTAPTLTVTAPRTMTLAAFRRGVRVTLRPSEAARLEVALQGTIASGRISAFNTTLATRTLTLAAGHRSVTLKPSRRVVGTPRKRSVKVRVRVVASDAAGNRRTATRTITVRR